MRALAGVTVLVTRPAGQAEALCVLLESQGAAPVRLPAMDIESVVDDATLAACMNAGESYDLVIFTSANAVKFGAQLLDRHHLSPLAAIGPATARALEEAGWPVTVTPAERFDSESLLAHPQLARLTDRRMLIVKGRHGRDLLQTQLTRRGAHVAVADVYQRTLAQPHPDRLAAASTALTAAALRVVTATSREIAHNLLRLATPALRSALDASHWLVPGERVAAALAEFGVTAPTIRAASAEDHDLVAALVRWRSSESGA
jgi:uroporphyrinogen-III synthase